MVVVTQSLLRQRVLGTCYKDHMFVLLAPNAQLFIINVSCSVPMHTNSAFTQNEGA